MLVLAIFPALTALAGFLNPRVRNVEAELPDIEQRKPEPKPEPAQEEAPAEATA
jgi:hypothetical protein